MFQLASQVHGEDLHGNTGQEKYFNPPNHFCLIQAGCAMFDSSRMCIWFDDSVSNFEEGQRLLLMQPQVLTQLQFRFAQLPQRPLS